MQINLLILLLSCIIGQCSANSNALNHRLLQLEYQIFVQTDDSSRSSLILEKAQLLRDNTKFNQAIDQLNRIGTKQPADILYAADRERAYCHFKIHAFDLSLYYSQKCDTLRRYSDTTLSFIYMHSLVQCGLYEECKLELQKWKVADSVIWCLADSVTEVDPRKYRHRSLFPGYGQLSLGKPRQAAYSFILSSGFASFTVYNAILLYPVTALVYGALPCIKFYSGGRINAANLSRARNKESEATIRKQYAECINAVFMRNK